MSPLGITLDPQRNAEPSPTVAPSSDDSLLPVIVVPTNEELEIANLTLAVVSAVG